jgi:hypothetical protein
LLIFLGTALLSWYVHWLHRDPYGGLKHNAVLGRCAAPARQRVRSTRAPLDECFTFDFRTCWEMRGRGL